MGLKIQLIANLHSFLYC